MEFEFSTWDYLGSVLYLLAVTPGIAYGVFVCIFNSNYERLGRVKFAPPALVPAGMTNAELLTQAIAQVKATNLLERVLRAPQHCVTVEFDAAAPPAT